MKCILTETLLFCIVTGCLGRIIKRQANIVGDCVIPDPTRSSGICTPIYSCAPMLNFLNNSEEIGSAAKEILKQYVCNNSNTEEISVCCPFRPIRILPRMLTVDPPAIDHSKHKNAHLLPSYCGILRSDPKIINGDVAGLNEFPWVAALRYKGSPTNFLCGGSLINNRYVLTAAHCVQNQKSELVGVRLGELDFTMDPDCELFIGIARFCSPPHQDFNISKFDTIVHPEYNPRTGQNDIALIRLREEANTTQYSVEPICLPVTIDQKEEKIDSYTVIGWGETENFRSNILLKANIPPDDNLKCSYANPPGYELTNKQLCAGGKNQVDVCNGDSGGPLMGDYIYGGEITVIQYGIVSFGSRLCNQENFPATYVKVASYMDWILDNLNP